MPKSMEGLGFRESETLNLRGMFCCADIKLMLFLGPIDEG